MKISRILSLITMVLVFLVISVVVYLFNTNSPFSASGEKQVVVIEKGESISSIASKLEKDRIIRSAFFFKLHSRFNGLDQKIKAGEYELSPAQSIKEIFSAIVAGRSLSQEKEIKIIPGWNIKEIAKHFADNGISSKDDAINVEKIKVSDWNLSFDKPTFLNDAPAGASLEGFLCPDTYRIFKDATTDDVIKKLLDNFDKKLTPAMRTEIARQHKTIFEIVTMASIIEKEVSKPADMAVVSGIFWNRIGSNYPLESCATLAYALGENKKQYTYEDTHIESPYNTYRHQGLPPGPICNPSFESIKAAIYPQATDYNYFLNSFDNGETIFSRTYQEHLRNKEKYLK